MPTKHIIAAVLAVVIGLAIYGAYQYPHAVQQAGVGSPAGSTFNSAKVAEITSVPISITATSSSVYNGDSSDRVVDSGFVSCATSSGSVYASTAQAVGVATWNWKAATTAVASLGLQGNVNYAFNLDVATSTTDSGYSATTTPGSTFQAFNRTWKAGTYMTFLTNATSTNQTINCQAGVYYHGT